MPLILILLGAFCLVIGFQDTQGQALTLLKGDFTGNDNFVYWILSIFVIGAVGYIPRMRPISDGFLLLVLLVIFLSNDKQTGAGGFFQKFEQSL